MKSLLKQSSLLSKSENLNFLTHVAIIGNPNTGKSTIFNYLTGSKQKTSNYPGATVEKKIADITFNKHTIQFIDLPGCYSLESQSKDEQVVVDFLKNNKKISAILFILDATNLKRNLYLLSQVLELNIPVIIVLTMVDRLEDLGISLDIQELSNQLQLTIIPVVGSDKNLLLNLKKYLFKKTIPQQKKFILPIVKKDQDRKLPLKVLIPKARYYWAQSIVSLVETRSQKKNKTWTDKIDRVLTHKIWGIFIFFSVMALVFKSIYSWSEPLMNGLDFMINQIKIFCSTSFSLSPILKSLLEDGIVSGVGSVIVFLPQIVILFIFVAILEDSGYLARVAFLMDKLFAWTGLNGRSFIPFLSCFACAVPGIMATRIISDYKTRLITILILPLVSCSARLPVYVLLIGAFIQPVYGVFWATFAFLAANLIGPIIAMILAFILNRSVLQKQEPTFFLEIPPYRLPSLKISLYRGYIAGKDFIVNAGSIILILSIIVWALIYFPRNESVQMQVNSEYKNQILTIEKKIDSTQDIIIKKDLSNQLLSVYKEIDLETQKRYLENSYLGTFGQFIAPIFKPLGYDWKITVGILASFPARELIISILGIIYNVEDTNDDEYNTLSQKLIIAEKEDGTKAYNPIVAISLIIFFALCSQCMSTLAIIKKELNSYKWAFVTFFYMTFLAYFLSFIVYQIGSHFFL